MFQLAGQVFFGLIVGILAKLINPGKARIGGVVAMALIGLVGSVVGTIIGHVGFSHPAAGWTLSIVGAVVSLCIYHFTTRARIHRESAATGESKNPL